MAVTARASSFLVLPILAQKTSISLFSVKFSAKLISQSLRASSAKLSARFVRHVAFSSDVDQEDGVLSEEEEYRKLFVGNLAFTIDNDRLSGLFEVGGNVETAEVVYDRATGRSRGFGFVTMATVEEAKRVAQMLNGYEIDGRAMRVNYGPPPPKRETSFNRGEGGFGSFNKGPRGGGGGVSDENRVYVSNLSWNVDDEGLRSFFSEVGNVLEAKVVKDYDTGRSRGFGFIKYESADDVSKAVSSLDGAEMDGRPLRVAVAESRPRRSFEY